MKFLFILFAKSKFYIIFVPEKTKSEGNELNQKIEAIIKEQQ